MPAQRLPRPLVAAAAVALAAVGLGAPAASAGGPVHRVVVEAPSPAVLDLALDAVRAAHGRVLARYAVADAAAVELAAGTRLPAGVTVVADRRIHVTSTGTSSAGVPDTMRATVGADAAPAADGHGVTVAVVDTGIADVPGLAGAVTAHDGPTGDGFGHGTFLAGLVAGRGDGRVGVAPAASLDAVRVAADDGSTSLSQVLAGLQAVSDRHAEDPSLRVLNLSLSSDEAVPPWMDPLARGLERLWHDGVVTVVAAGNDGPADGTVTSPGDDPLVLTVGALDEAGTAGHGDDTQAAFSARTAALGKPDVLAPGVHLLSLRTPGSTVDVAYPQARVGDSLFRGSGSSMAAAVVSGVVADLLSARPDLTPDQVKALLAGSAYAVPGSPAGGVDLPAALSAELAPAEGRGPDAAHDEAWQRFADAWDSGDQEAVTAAWHGLDDAAQREASRLFALGVAASGTDLDPQEWQARSWSARSWSADAFAGRSWSADTWLARSWSARSWSDVDWTGRSWSAGSWSGRSWSARSWSARSWSGRSWSARSWSARSWSARSWSGRSWSARSWSARSWSARSWSARSWSARSWSARSWSARSWSARSWAAADWSAT